MTENNISQTLLERGVKRGKLLRDMGRTEEAIACFRKALEIQPELTEAHYELAYTLALNGRVEGAINHWQRALETNPNFVPALDDLATVLATCPNPALRDGPKAIELASRANQLKGGQDPKILRTLAAAYAQGGRFTDAVTSAQQALRLAQAQTNLDLANALRTEIELYQTNSPFPADGGPQTPVDTSLP